MKNQNPIVVPETATPEGLPCFHAILRAVHYGEQLRVTGKMDRDYLIYARDLREAESLARSVARKWFDGTDVCEDPRVHYCFTGEVEFEYFQERAIITVISVTPTTKEQFAGKTIKRKAA